MRKTSFVIFALLFITACFPLFSQHRIGAGSKIYVAPISGYGSVDDNMFFQKQVSYEVVLQYHDAVMSKRTSQYTLKGLIEPYTGEVSSAAAAVHIPDNSHPVPPRPVPRVRNNSDRREFFSWEADGNMLFYDTSDDVNILPSNEPVPEKFNIDNLEFIFYLALVNNKTDQSIAEQYIIYKITDDSVSRMVSVMVQNILASIPVSLERVASSDFRNKWLFLDACVLWAPRLYVSQSQSISWLNFGAAVTAEFHFINFMSLGAGVQLTQDWIVVKHGVEEYQDLILEIPFTIRFAFKPGSTLMIEPYTGVFGNISLMNTTRPSAFSWLLGCQIGIDMGPGMLVIDPRFALDFYESSLNTSLEYRRYLLQFGFGYKFGFFQK